MSLFRVFSKVYQLGWRNTLRQLTFHDDIAVGTLIGTDRNGNRYFENRSDINQPGYRDRWIEYSQGFTRNVSQIDPEWHPWLHHITLEPPHKDAVMQASRQPWQHVRFSSGLLRSFSLWPMVGKQSLDCGCTD